MTRALQEIRLRRVPKLESHEGGSTPAGVDQLGGVGDQDKAGNLDDGRRNKRQREKP